jgi:hypothetical protein
MRYVTLFLYIPSMYKKALVYNMPFGVCMCKILIFFCSQLQQALHVSALESFASII